MLNRFHIQFNDVQPSGDISEVLQLAYDRGWVLAAVPRTQSTIIPSGSIRKLAFDRDNREIWLWWTFDSIRLYDLRSIRSMIEHTPTAEEAA